MIGWRTRRAHGAPRILLLGPSGAGKTALVRAAARRASPAARPAAADGRVAWTDVGAGVIIDVPGAIAFPPAGIDLTAWERLLRRLRRLRPWRPIDAVILALPVPLLLEPDRQDERLHVSAAIRERFALLQRVLGFTLPVYVVITKAEEIPGFDTFTRTLAEEQLRNMFGWSNPYGTTEPFSPAWVDEGIASLHDAVVRARLERFASSTHLPEGGDLFLFTRTLSQIATPLRTLLGDVLRPSPYREAFTCRGFYFCGRVPDDPEAIAFLDDLLSEKVFAERGLAAPEPAVAEERRRSSLAALVACALLIVGLGLALYWTSTRLRRAQDEFLALLGRAEAMAAARQQAVQNGRPLAAASRLQQTRRLLDEQLEAINSDGVGWIVYRLNPSLGGTLTRIFSELVLDDFRVALEDKGRSWLRAARQPALDPPPSGPDFEDRPRYRALARFAQGYAPFVSSYRRYEDLRRDDGNGTIASLAAISEYIDGTPLAVHALGRPYARALRDADAAPVDCRIFLDASGHSLVVAEAAALLDEFRDWTFDEKNPVRAAARDFTEGWERVSGGSGDPFDLESLMIATASLSEAATAWTTLDTAITNQPLALFQDAPFTPGPADPALCPGLRWPDLSEQLVHVERVKDTLRDELRAMQVEPFGPLFTDDDAGLALSEPVAALKKDLDALQAQPFWVSPSDAFLDDPPSALPRFATWRTDDLDAAVKTADAFLNYRGGAFGAVASPPRDALLDVVEAAVAEVIAVRLRRTAVAGQDVPDDPAGMLEQLKVGGSVVAKVGSMASLLGRSESGGIVLAALSSQAAAALAAIDGEASRQYPWLFSWPRRADTFEGFFRRWQNLRRTAPAAEVPKLWEAAADVQRDAAVQFAAVARPFSTYLVARRGLSEPALRWARISRDVARYEQKVPDNGLGALDAFVRQGVPAMVPASGCGGGSTAAARATGDYFPLLRDDLAREGERQCHLQIQRDYAALVDVFNARLKDRFPFVESAAGPFAERIRAVRNRPEATPEGVKALLDEYRRLDGPSVTRFLAARETCPGDPALAFVQGVDTMSTLFASAADPALKTPTIVLDVLPEFRPLPDAGTGGDHVAEWRLEVGSRSVGEPLAAPPTPLPWTYGDRVSLVIRFARDSPSVPAPGAGFAPAGTTADDRTVRFDFNGNWAMFQLLLARTMPREVDAALVRDLPPTVLAFDIPVRPDPAKPPLAKPEAASPFELFMRLGVLQRGKSELLTVGALPTGAPATVACLGS